jgi:glycosyltransferase involved in cell wall biosynthesis
MVRVLNVISDANIGGAGRVLLNYLKYADRAEFETGVCLPRGSLLAGPLRSAGADVHELPIHADKSFDPGDIGVLKALIRKTRPDIVHTHGSLSGRIAARRCGCAVVYPRHSVCPPGRFVKAGPGRLLNKLVNERYADRIIAVSPAARDNLTDAGIDAGLIDIVMNGVEPVARRPASECEEYRAGLGLGSGELVLGILARLESYKGHAVILEALKELTDEGRRVKLLVAGTGSDEAAVKARAAELGLDGSVRFLGFVDDVASVLSVLDVQLNASYGTEASSLSLLEGMSMGLPAVVSDYGGNPYVISDGVNGLVFKSRDSGGLARCVRRLTDEPDLTEKLKAGALQIYAERFTGRKFAEGVEQTYKKALKK